MAFFENTRIGYKLISGYLIMGAIMIAIALFGVVNMNMIAENGNVMYYEALLPVHSLDDIDTEYANIRVNVMRYISFPKEREELKEEISNGFTHINTQLNYYRSEYAHPSDYTDLDRISTLIRQLQEEYQPVFNAADEGRQNDAIDLVSADSNRVSMRNEMQSIINNEINEALQHADELRKTSNNAAYLTAIIFIFITIAAVVASLIFGIILSRSITTPLAEVVSVAEQIGQGTSSARVGFSRRDEIGTLGSTLNKMGTHINAMVEDTRKLSYSAQKGELSTRADPAAHEGDYRLIITGFNEILDAVIGPLNVAAEYVDRISKGDIPSEIVDTYYGDFNEIKNNLNTCIRAVNLLIEDSNHLTEAAVKGELTTRADTLKHEGDFRTIVEGVNATLDAVIEPLHEAMRVSQEFASGNFGARVNESLHVQGDFIEFKNALNRIGIELSRMMTMINDELFESVNVLSSASSEILSITAELSSSTAQTATSVNETSATVEEVRKTTEMTNNKAKAVAEKSMAVSDVAETGQQSVEEILSGMTHIQQQMESIAGSVVKLSEQSQAIGEIIATVTDIAEQSNLLAVNASIEAAKAGEYGRGFGVVAQEIKNLAEQSKQATTHIRTILTDIQRGISSTVLSTEQGTKTVATGLRLTTEARDAIEILSQSINEAARSSVQITSSSQEQVVGMDQISAAMESIRMAAQNNLEVTRQVEKTAKDLHDLGIALKQITERFNLS